MESVPTIKPEAGSGSESMLAIVVAYFPALQPLSIMNVLPVTIAASSLAR